MSASRKVPPAPFRFHPIKKSVTLYTASFIFAIDYGLFLNNKLPLQCFSIGSYLIKIHAII